jgi:hypothetical protein
MKPTTNSVDGKNLAWFIDLLNEGRSPDPHVADRRKPANKKRLAKKRIDLLKLEPSPDGLRAEIGGLMRTILNLLVGFNASSGALRFANEIAKQCLSSPRFVADRSGKLLVHRAAPPGAGVRAPLLIDAMGVLTYLVERGLHSRLKSCLGYRAPQYRGEPARRCSFWFNGASNKDYCSTACRKKAERLRNNEDYRIRQREFMREKRKEEKEEEGRYFSRERRTKSKTRRNASTRTSGADTRPRNEEPIE